MTALAHVLIRQIAQSGPLTVADYMSACLLHPTLGYYTTRTPFGAQGDFITAPETSQMFGELLGLCLAQAWMDQGSPAPFTLAELGPGRGTCMADILRATRAVPGFHAAAQVVLVEASAKLRALQAETVAHPHLHWADSVAALPDQPLFLIANEFFDALPIRQFLRDAAGWRERLIGAQGDSLTFGLSDPIDPALMDPRFADDPPGSLVEICPSAPAIMAEVGHRLQKFGGAALVIDYGGWRSRGDTLQALRAHRFDPPLAHPGEADLTAHVDFEALCPPTIAHSALIPQGTLLTRLGIIDRASRLAKNLSGPALENHLAALHRLTAPSEMGTLFQAIAFFPLGAPLPPGFDLPHA